MYCALPKLCNMHLFKSPKQFFNEYVVLHPIQNVLQLLLSWLSVNRLSEPKTKILGLITCRKAHVHANIISSPSIQLTRWGYGRNNCQYYQNGFQSHVDAGSRCLNITRQHTESVRFILQPRPPTDF
jgi:hypothetical protein